MYLGRSEPLGPHLDVIRHILFTQGTQRIFDKSRLSLFSVAHHRLQARQILLREAPDPCQMTWMSLLNTCRPDIRISADVLQMCAHSATARILKEKSSYATTATLEEVEHVQLLVHKIQDFIISIDQWTSNTPKEWKPNLIDPGDTDQYEDMFGASYNSSLCISSPQTLDYHSIGLLYMWNLHSASQIILRESLIDIIIHKATLKGLEMPDMEDMDCIQGERRTIERLSATIIRSFPLLMGFTNELWHNSYIPRQGKMAGRFLYLFPMSVIKKAELTSPLHKLTASKVIDWINSSHGLG